MRRRFTIVVLMLVGVTLAIGLAEVRFGEPRYGGKRLSAWLAELDLETSRPSEPGLHAVQMIGTNSFPLLTRMIRSTDPRWKRAVLGLNAWQRFLKVPVLPASTMRNRAVQGYMALGARAKPNVPALMDLLQMDCSSEVRSSVAAALGGIGPEAAAAIPVLLRAASDKNAEVRKESLWALANIQRWSPDTLHFSPMRY
jgi:hypothetical protein